MTKDNQVASFLIEELKQNWSYIRHIEEIRLKHANIFLIITGAVISVLSFLVQIPDSTLGQKILNDTVINYRIPIMFGSGFLCLYGSFLCIFLSLQKRGYEHYRIVNAEIRNWFMTNCDEKDSFSFLKEIPTTRPAGKLLKSTFFFWYLLIAVVSMFAFSIFCITILSWLAPSWLFIHWVVISFSISIVILIIEIGIFVKVNRNIKISFE